MDPFLPPNPNTFVVLIADDDPVMRNLARLVCEKEGCFVLTANDGDEALALSRAFKGQIHLLLSDIQMKQMDGPALREHLLRDRPATNVILMSANASAVEDVTFLQKPLDLSELAAEIRKVTSASIAGRLDATDMRLKR
jgi:two-component system, cell cycle sensor histidine kinase and response regulator CckA